MRERNMQKNKSQWNMVKTLNHTIEKDCNFLGTIVAVSLFFYPLYLFWVVHLDYSNFHFLMEVVLMYFAYLRYNSMTVIYSDYGSDGNLSANLMPFPVNRKILVLSHGKAVLLIQIVLACAAILALGLYRGSWMFTWKDISLFGFTVVNTLVILLIKEGRLMRR